MMKKLFSSILLAGFGICSYAQQPLPVTPIDYSIVKSGQTVTATLTLASNKRGGSSYRITAKPLLSKGNQRVQMPMVVFRTTKGRILDFRNQVTYPTGSTIAHRGEEVQYRYTFPYKAWMDQAQWTIHLASNGCGAMVSLPICLVAQNVVLPPDTAYVVRPVWAYETPLAAPKFRIEQGSAYLSFPVGSWRLVGDFKNNAFELGKINSSIELITSDRGNKIIQGIDLWGTSSPEGSYERNSKLSKNRAQSVLDYIARNYPGVTSNNRVTSTAEDWSGLVQALAGDPSDWAQQVIDIAQSSVADDAKDQMIRAIDNGVTYRYLLNNIYPKLRRVDYKVRYVIRDFTESEVAQLYDSRPEELSLIELYRLAMSYPSHSTSFYDVMRSSATLYPQDQTALLNAATATLENGNEKDAARFLNKVTTSSKEYYNTLGVLQMINGQYELAAAHLHKAYAMGLTVAGENLEQLKIKLKNIALLNSQK